MQKGLEGFSILWLHSLPFSANGTTDVGNAPFRYHRYETDIRSVLREASQNYQYQIICLDANLPILPELISISRSDLSPYSFLITCSSVQAFHKTSMKWMLTYRMKYYRIDSWTLEEYTAANNINFFGNKRLSDKLVAERFYYCGGSFRCFLHGSRFAQETLESIYR
jgi:hypothetical protein